MAVDGYAPGVTVAQALCLLPRSCCPPTCLSEPQAALLPPSAPSQLPVPHAAALFGPRGVAAPDRQPAGAAQRDQ